jgi:hypothetical protein
MKNDKWKSKGTAGRLKAEKKNRNLNGFKFRFFIL